MASEAPDTVPADAGPTVDDGNASEVSLTRDDKEVRVGA